MTSQIPGPTDITKGEDINRRVPVADKPVRVDTDSNR